jgi:hypothetical protein
MGRACSTDADEKLLIGLWCENENEKKIWMT